VSRFATLTGLKPLPAASISFGTLHQLLADGPDQPHLFEDLTGHEACVNRVVVNGDRVLELRHSWIRS